MQAGQSTKANMLMIGMHVRCSLRLANTHLKLAGEAKPRRALALTESRRHQPLLYKHVLNGDVDPN